MAVNVPRLRTRRLLIAACGSIHSALLPSYIQVLQQKLAVEIRVVMTPAASSVIPARTIRQYTGHDVYIDLWPAAAGEPPAHVSLAQWADHLLVLPATANMLGKAANGIADDLVSTLLVTYAGPITFAPAMNATMWASPAVQRNVKLLEADGRSIIWPAKCSPVAADRRAGEGLSPSIRMVIEYFAAMDSDQEPAPRAG